MTRVCVVDTTFARVDLGGLAVQALQKFFSGAIIARFTVPGIKDIPRALKNLMLREECDAGMSLGWVGPSMNDKLSYLAYSIGLQMLQLELLKPVMDVTIHEDEAEESLLPHIARDRVEKHAENLYLLLHDPRKLESRAGRGYRQGHAHAGPIE